VQHCLVAVALQRCVREGEAVSVSEVSCGINYVTIQLDQLSLASLQGRYIEYHLCWDKDGNVTSALCYPIWHVAGCKLLYSVYFTVTFSHVRMSCVCDFCCQKCLTVSVAALAN